jgi:hypothetical protein
MTRYTNYIKYSAYSDLENVSNLGYKVMSYKRNIFSRSDFKIDFFKNDDVRYNTFIYRDTELSARASSNHWEDKYIWIIRN